MEIFIRNFTDYKMRLIELFKTLNYKSLIDDLIIGYVIFVANLNEKYKDIDIFKDKRSICYIKI